jgi:hypothetical protein
MRPAFSEPAKNDPSCEIRLGVASWDDGSGTAHSVKYTWFDKNEKAARGGELPVEALPQALDFAIRKGYINLTCSETHLREMDNDTWNRAAPGHTGSPKAKAEKTK